MTTTPNAGAVSEAPTPFGYAHKYHEPFGRGFTWVYGETYWNGQQPIESMPLYRASDYDALSQQLAELQRERDSALPADDLRRALRDRLDATEQENAKLRRELADYESSAKIQWDCRMRAIKRWQEAHPGNDMRWPDGADLLVWLMEQVNG